MIAADGHLIAHRRFSSWPEHGYSVTFSNCQCFCFRFTLYICDGTRDAKGRLNSRNLPIRIAKVQAYVLAGLTSAWGIGWLSYFWPYFWPLGWRTVLGVAYLSMIALMVRIFLQYVDSLGGWRGSELSA